MRAYRFLGPVVLCVSLPATADYAEECLSEGCSEHEIDELYSSYREECLNEGCSREEVIELAGGPQHVTAMLQAFRERGYEVDPPDGAAAECRGTGTTTSCAAVFLMCKDWYFCPGEGPDLCEPDDLFCPGGNMTSSSYVCGVCIGFDWF